MDALTELIGVLQRTKAGSASGTPSTPYLHGPNGLWSVSGVERDVISTRIRPRGLAGALAARASRVEYPLYPYLTGFTNPAEVNPTGVCDDPPTAGQMKNCLQTAQYGRYSYQTRELAITEIGGIINRSEFTDLNLLNNPVAGITDGNGNGIPVPGSVPANLSLMNEVMARFVELGVKFQNKIMRQVYEGNPANNTGGGGYKEFPGLDILIGTGKVDAETGTTCPTLDSTVLNLNYKKVTDTSGNDDIVNVLTYLMRYLKDTAERTGLASVEWAIVMRPGAFYEITNVWPCSYLTYRCAVRGQTATGASTDVVLDANDAIQMRDSMRNGQFLVIDGERVRVILDDAIAEESSGDTNRVSATCFASDIYVVPLTILNGTYAATFWEYFDWAGPNAAMDVVNSGLIPDRTFWSDGGKYLWHFKTPINWCVQWLSLIKPRLVLRTPHLAARLTNVQYCPLIHERDSFPDDPYFINGGNTSRNTTPSLYNEW